MTVVHAAIGYSIDLKLSIYCRCFELNIHEHVSYSSYSIIGHINEYPTKLFCKSQTHTHLVNDSVYDFN